MKRSRQAMVHGKEGELETILHTQLVEDVREVVFHGLYAD
jgi:hypothetical protein